MSHRCTRGLTLLELLVAMSIMAMVVVSLGTLANGVQQGFDYTEGHSTATQHARVTLERITRSVREAQASEQFPGAGGDGEGGHVVVSRCAGRLASHGHRGQSGGVAVGPRVDDLLSEPFDSEPAGRDHDAFRCPARPGGEPDGAVGRADRRDPSLPATQRGHADRVDAHRDVEFGVGRTAAGRGPFRRPADPLGRPVGRLSQRRTTDLGRSGCGSRGSTGRRPACGRRGCGSSCNCCPARRP